MNVFSYINYFLYNQCQAFYFLILMKDDGFFNHKLSLVLFKYYKCHQHRIYCARLLKRKANTELDWA